MYNLTVENKYLDRFLDILAMNEIEFNLLNPVESEFHGKDGEVSFNTMDEYNNAVSHYRTLRASL